MNLLDSLRIISLPPQVEDALGLLSPFVLLALNLLAIGVILLVAWRLAVIAMTAITDFKDGKNSSDESSFAIVKGAALAGGVTIIAGMVAFLSISWGLPTLLDMATDANASISTSISNKGGSPLDEFLKANPLLDTVYTFFQGVAPVIIIALAGLMMAKTGLDALRYIKYNKASADVNNDNTVKPLKQAFARVVMIGVLGVVGWIAVVQGPRLLFQMVANLDSNVCISTSAECAAKQAK